MKRLILTTAMLCCLKTAIAINLRLYSDKIDDEPIELYTKTGEEIIINLCNDTILNNTNTDFWELYIDIRNGNSIRHEMIDKKSENGYVLSSDCIIPRQFNYVRYKCDSTKSIYYHGILKRFDVNGHIDSMNVLFDLLPSYPEVNVLMTYDEWDYDMGWMADPTNDAVLTINHKNTELIYMRYQEDVWWNHYSTYVVCYTTPDSGSCNTQTYNKNISLDVGDKLDICVRNQYGDIKYPSILTEDLITDSLQRESMMQLKDSITTDIREIQIEEPTIKEIGLTLYVDIKDQEKHELKLYDLMGRLVDKSLNKITAPQHGMYILRIKSNNKTWNKKIKL